MKSITFRQVRPLNNWPQCRVRVFPTSRRSFEAFNTCSQSDVCGHGGFWQKLEPFHFWNGTISSLKNKQPRNVRYPRWMSRMSKGPKNQTVSLCSRRLPRFCLMAITCPESEPVTNFCWLVCVTWHAINSYYRRSVRLLGLFGSITFQRSVWFDVNPLLIQQSTLSMKVAF